MGHWKSRSEAKSMNEILWLLKTHVTAGFWGLKPRQERTASCPTRWLLSSSSLRLIWAAHCFREKIRNLKTSHSVTVREGWVMSANLAGLRTLNNQSWWWRQNACDADHNEDKVVEGVTDNWHSPVLSPSVLSRGLVALLVGLDPRIVGNKYRFIHQNIFSLRAWSYPSDQWHQE